MAKDAELHGTRSWIPAISNSIKAVAGVFINIGVGGQAREI
jgi:hypothetical protein